MKRTKIFFSVLGILGFVLLIANLLMGDVLIPLTQIWKVFTGGECDVVIRHIVLSIRLVRTVVVVLVGAALSVSGLQMQTVFRNPLADPYMLGISSGASLGVALFILALPLLGLDTGVVWQSLGVAGAGWVGAAVVLLCITLISRQVGNILGVLILGIMLGYVIGAVIQILQYMSSAEQLKTFFLWSMGSVGHVTVSQLCIMLPLLAMGLLLSAVCIKPLNLLLLGEEYAQTMGLDVRRSRTILFFSTSLLAGTVTAFCGPVGFLGLAVPHVARWFLGNADHRVLLPGTLLTGCVFMLICDLLAKLLVLPLNCITALLGVPVILWVICQKLRLL